MALLFIKPVLNNLIYDANKTDIAADNVNHSGAIITRKNSEKNEMSFRILKLSIKNATQHILCFITLFTSQQTKGVLILSKHNIIGKR